MLSENECFNIVNEGRLVASIEECARLEAASRGCTVTVERIHPQARIPVFAHDGDACADISTPVPFSIGAGETVRVGAGIAIQLPPGWEAQIRSRSGLLVKGIRVSGTIDHGYRSEIHILMTNTSRDYRLFDAGDRIAQVAVRPVPRVVFEEGAVVPTGRGGLGSSGMGPLEVRP